MRRFITLAVAVLLVIGITGIAGIASGSALAKNGGFLPGSFFFPLQQFTEQTLARLQSSEKRQVGVYFMLGERRLENLVVLTGTADEIIAMRYLSKTIDQAIQSWSQLPSGSVDSFRDQLLSLLIRAEIAINRLEVASIQHPDQVASLLAKLSTLQKLAEDPLANPVALAGLVQDIVPIMAEAFSGQANDPNATIDPLAVPFPPGSLASQHAFYPLVGQHAEIECTDCHYDGVYDGTPVYCEACHTEEQSTNHFVGDCAACHSAFSWSDVIFDHTLVNTSNCMDCHAVDKPTNHYGNQCASCHNTSAWKPANFNHQAAGAEDCKSCHSGDKPSNHFSGQCSACHSTNSWKGASFNHNGQTDCKSCHSGDKPPNHFSGQCSACHSTNNWNASFSHSGQTDCASCHSGDKPSNHFSGQCSACHSTNDWVGEFNHSGQTDCKSCHAGDRPNDHDSGQCSQCHSQNDWDADEDDGDGDDEDKGGEDKDDEDKGGEDKDDEDKGGEDKDDEDEGDEDKDDEDKGDDQGILDFAPANVAAGIQPPMECSACHVNGKMNDQTSHYNTMASWWIEFLVTFQKLVSRSVG